MAKVSGPLYSMSASGKIGDALVFFGWKGNNVVRGWVKPSNKMSGTQGDQRIMIGGTGRAVGEIKPEKAFAQQLIDLKLIPGGQTKQSFIVKYILDHYLIDAAAYAAALAELTGHTSYGAFQAAADTLGLVAFDLPYAVVAPYDKALGLYLIAKTAVALALTGTPYTTNITAWVTADVQGMITDFTTA
jgi:hypothetical protein